MSTRLFVVAVMSRYPQRDAGTYTGSRKQRALLLGMVFSEEMEPKRGQEFRDRVRCEALEKEMDVLTLDNKHEDATLLHGKHCQANFADTRRMFRSMKERFGSETKFDFVILDYFFSPVGWARERWTEALFRDTLPTFVRHNLLTKDGEIWLPNLQCVKELIDDFSDVLHSYFHIELREDPMENPLYRATEEITDVLMRCPDTLTNETQIRPLNAFSKTPFYCLKRKNNTSPPNTPSSRSLTDREDNTDDSSPERSPPRRKYTPSAASESGSRKKLKV